MKLIHTSDIHLASSLTSRLPAAKALRRAQELWTSLAEICERGEALGAKAVIISGDLFDTQKITAKNLDTLLAIIERFSNLLFFYLPGNHEREALSASLSALPENLFIFGSDWTYFELGDIRLCGRTQTARDMHKTLQLGPGKNIVVLHGELREHSLENGVIGIKDFSELDIDYMALGHYHSYSSTPLGRRGAAVYSGTPEGRGFDEAGEKGFCLIDASQHGISHKFIPCAKRRLIIKDVDVSSAERTAEVERLITNALLDIGEENIVRIKLVGSKGIQLKPDLALITARFEKRFFYFEIKDCTRLAAEAEDFRYDKSLRGEFIRLCLSDPGLEEELRQKIIYCGLSALDGEAFDE